jgi:pyruvate formate-lyase/glycerol dehydratase family glycyl radical enzyme
VEPVLEQNPGLRPAPRRGGRPAGKKEEDSRREKALDRARAIRADLHAAPLHLCPERAFLVTEFFKHFDDPSEPAVVRKAKALRYLLSRKSVKIFPRELIVGNPGKHRKVCLLQPELASTYMSQELLRIEKRRPNPMRISARDRFRLATEVIPYWLPRCMPSRMFPGPVRAARYIRDQLDPAYYLINEAGGIGHFLPDYEKMIRLGTRGYREILRGRDGRLHRAARIVCEALEIWASRFSARAGELAARERDPGRRRELEGIARVCRKVPQEPAETFHEAVQSLWFTHLAVNLESINSAVSLGRIDQVLYPYYRRDLDRGGLDRARALDLLLCFSAKATEHVFLVSRRISEYHGGFLVVQAAIVGGMDREGNDAVNPLTDLLLEVMENHRMRDPNFQARVHRNSPPAYLERALDVARQGYGVPALFNDEATIASLTEHGIPVEEARDYGIVGCVEPSLPGKSFLSTDAALLNLPVCVELALNRGRPWNGRRRAGAPTPDPRRFRSMEDVMDAFARQLDHRIDRLVEDLQMVERGNRDHHPTPLSSLLVAGCLESGKDLTEGGALFNASGIQAVGLADAADALAALDHVVFRKGRVGMPEVVEALRTNFAGTDTLRAELEKAPKFGNDLPLPDGYARRLVRLFHDSLARHVNTRGGPYVPGFYSVTCNVAFGRRTGALPSGRRAGEPFASSIGAAAHADRSGPTALLNSVASLESRLMPNGNALNLRFDPAHLAGEEGLRNLTGLVRGFFDQGGLELQLNVVDPETLQDARAHPGKYPELVVRVAGYCAYFDDLPDSAKQEIIQRTRQKIRN